MRSFTPVSSAAKFSNEFAKLTPSVRMAGYIVKLPMDGTFSASENSDQIGILALDDFIALEELYSASKQQQRNQKQKQNDKDLIIWVDMDWINWPSVMDFVKSGAWIEVFGQIDESRKGVLCATMIRSLESVESFSRGKQLLLGSFDYKMYSRLLNVMAKACST